MQRKGDPEIRGSEMAESISPFIDVQALPEDGNKSYDAGMDENGRARKGLVRRRCMFH